VSGVVRAAILTREQTIEFGDIAKANNVEKVVDGRRVLLNTISPEPREWYITVVIGNAGQVPSFHQSRFTLLDANDKPLRSGGSGSRGGGKWSAFHLDFTQGPDTGPPEMLRVVIPAETKEIEIPFEFKR
jgi:hypothetical protein